MLCLFPLKDHFISIIITPKSAAVLPLWCGVVRCGARLLLTQEVWLRWWLPPQDRGPAERLALALGGQPGEALGVECDLGPVVC